MRRIGFFRRGRFSNEVEKRLLNDVTPDIENKVD